MNVFKTNKVHNFVSCLLLTILTGCFSDTDSSPTVEQSNEQQLLSQKNNNRLTERLMTDIPPEGLNANGAFKLPKAQEVLTGNLLVSVDVEDEDGIAEVYITFNDSDYPSLYLCSDDECGGTKYHATKSAINLSEHGIYHGPVTLSLWVADESDGHYRQQVDSVEIEWYRSRIENLSVTRNDNGDTINVSWPSNHPYLNHNVYIASEPYVGVHTYKQLANGQAFLANESNSQTITNLNPDLTYYLSVVGVSGSGEGAFSTEVIIMPSSGVTNSAPLASSDQFLGDEDHYITGNLLANDFDDDENSLYLTAIPTSFPAQGTVYLTPDGNFYYYPPENFFGDVQFSYEIQDGHGGFSQAVVNLTVNSVNDLPIANNDSASTDENTPVRIDVLANDSDVEDSHLTIAIPDEIPNGTIEHDSATDELIFTPIDNYNGITAFSYTITDSDGGSATADITINVASVNSAPIATADSANVDEDNSVQINVLANDSDADNDQLSVSNVTQPSNGSVTISDNLVLYTPNADFNGSDSFTYTVVDALNASATANVTVTVAPINDSPKAVADETSTNAGESVTVNVLANDFDVDGDTLSVTDVSGDIGDAIVNDDHTITFIAVEPGTANVTYDISDGQGGVATGLLTVTILGSVNQAPIAHDDFYFVKANETLVVDGSSELLLGILANDIDLDNDTLTFTISSDVTDGTLVIQDDGTFTYTPSASFVSTDSFVYQVSDQRGGTDSATVTFSLMINDPPIANPDFYPLSPNSSIGFTSLLDNDFDLNQDTILFNGIYSVADQTLAPLFGSLVPDDAGGFTYTPNIGFAGNDSFFYEISDGQSTSIALATLSVSEVFWLNKFTLPHIPNKDYRSITFDGVDYFISGQNQILHSNDGLDWDASYQDISSNIKSVAIGYTSLTRSVSTGIALTDTGNYFVHQGNLTDKVSEGVDYTFNQHLWSERNTVLADNLSIVSEQMEWVVYYGNLFFMLGLDKIYFSDDGATWNDISPPVNNARYYDFASFKDTLIAVGENGLIAVFNNSAWQVITHDFGTSALYSLATSADRVVAVGTNGQVLTSTDGVNWSQASSLTSSTLNGVAYSDSLGDSGMFLAVGMNGTAMTSSDGLTWSNHSLDAADLYDVTWDGSRFIMVGDSGTVLMSPNGLSFSPVEQNDYSHFKAIAFNQASNILVRAGEGTDLLSSGDGFNWLPSMSQGFYHINQVKFINNQFIAVGNAGLVMTSVDGLSWAEQPQPTTENINDIHWYQGTTSTGTPLSYYVAVGDKGLLMTSTDAVTWQVEAVNSGDAGPVTDNLYGVTHDTDYLVAVGDNGQILVRDYSIEPGQGAWMSFSNPSFGQLNGIIFDGTENIIVGNAGVIVKGLATTSFSAFQASAITENLNAIAWNNDSSVPFYMAVGDNGANYTSNDAISWHANALGTSDHLRDVVLVDEQAFAVGDNGAFIVGVPNAE